MPKTRRPGVSMLSQLCAAEAQAWRAVRGFCGITVANCSILLSGRATHSSVLALLHVVLAGSVSTSDVTSAGTNHCNILHAAQTCLTFPLDVELLHAVICPLRQHRFHPVRVRRRAAAPRRRLGPGGRGLPPARRGLVAGVRVDLLAAAGPGRRIAAAVIAAGAGFGTARSLLRPAAMLVAGQQKPSWSAHKLLPRSAEQIVRETAKDGGCCDTCRSGQEQRARGSSAPGWRTQSSSRCWDASASVCAPRPRFRPRRRGSRRRRSCRAPRGSCARRRCPWRCAVGAAPRAPHELPACSAGSCSSSSSSNLPITPPTHHSAAGLLC